jgi:hypothetical protein
LARRSDNKSCMTRESHVQFCEQRWGKFLTLTRLIILVKNERQYRRARKRLFEVLRELYLEVSPQKTRMGKLDVFHFLGVKYECARIRCICLAGESPAAEGETSATA